MTLTELKEKLVSNIDTYGGAYRMDCWLSAIEEASTSLSAFENMCEAIGFICGLSCLGYISKQEEHDLIYELTAFVGTLSGSLCELIMADTLAFCKEVCESE